MVGIIIRGLAQTILRKFSVIVTLGGGGGGGGGGKAISDAKKDFIVRKYCFYNTEHLVNCSVDFSGSMQLCLFR